MLIELKYMIEKFSLRISGVLHVGAHLGEEHGAYKENGIEKVTWVECNSELIEKVRRKVCPNQVIHALVSDHKGIETLYKTNQSQCWSILKPHKNLMDRPSLKLVETVTLECDTLDNLVDDKQEYNLLNFDIQGAELRALKGYTLGLRYIDYIYTEVHEAETYMDCAKIHELDKFLTDFERVETKMLNRGWGDALYIRK